MYSSAMVRTKQKEENKVEKISFRGNKFGLTFGFVLILSLCSAAGTYRLKKTSQIKRWEKASVIYTQTLEEENQQALQGEK